MCKDESKTVVVNPRSIRTALCAESLLVENGYFYLPDGLLNSRQIYRRIKTVFDENVGRRVLNISDEVYINDGGKFIPLFEC